MDDETLKMSWPPGSWIPQPNGPAAWGIGFQNCFYPDVENKSGTSGNSKMLRRYIVFVGLPFLSTELIWITSCWRVVNLWACHVGIFQLGLTGLTQLVAKSSWIFLDYHQSKDLDYHLTQPNIIKKHRVESVSLMFGCTLNEPSKNPMPWRRVSKRHHLLDFPLRAPRLPWNLTLKLAMKERLQLWPSCDLVILWFVPGGLLYSAWI
jgi:hypothetical protein